MAVTAYWYPAIFPVMAQAGVGSGATYNWVADSASMRCALMGTNFTGSSQSLSVADYWNDVSAYEIATFTGYTAGGKTIGTTAVAVGSTSNKTVKFSGGASTVWTAATLTARGAVVYKAGSNVTNSNVKFFLDFGADVPCGGGDFTITWNTDGMATVVTA